MRKSKPLRLQVIVEGETEGAFVRRVLTPHLKAYDIAAAVQILGGWNKYEKVKKHIKNSMYQQHVGEWHTTMLDLYAVPDDFPKISQARNIRNTNERITFLEQAFREDIVTDGHWHFVPYLQKHEFEALIFADPQKLALQFLEYDKPIEKLVDLSVRYSPEEINDKPESAPSKRIIAQIPEYRFRKAGAGPLVVEKIGLPRLRERCPHFHAWITKLEELPSKSKEPKDT